MAAASAKNGICSIKLARNSGNSRKRAMMNVA